MAAVKLLISGLANTGKTSLLKDLKDTLVIAHDGKKFPFKIPHVNVDDFISAAELIQLTNDKISAYEKRFKEFPKTVVFDSVSKVFETMNNYCNERYSGFTVYSTLDKEVTAFTNYIENILIANGVNVIIVSHATYDADTANYTLVGKGSFQKKGGFLSLCDHGIFLETKNGKRLVHLKSGKFPARTTLSDIPDSMSMEEYSLSDHMDKIASQVNEADEFIL